MRIVLAWLGIVASAVGLVIDAALIFPMTMTASPANPVARSFVDAFLYFWSFFTHLTNLWLVLIYLAVVTGWRRLSGLIRPVPLASAAAFITLVMLFYHFMLAPTLVMEGALAIATWLMHYVAPVLYLVWWVLCAPHGTLRFRHLPLLLLPGIAYVAWVLLRGLVVGEYPYDILDAGKFGYLQVAIGVAVLLVAVAGFSAMLVGIDRLRARQGGGT